MECPASRLAARPGLSVDTHAFDLAGKMTVEQVQEAAKLGAFIEFDFRNTLEGGRMDAIRRVGPEFCFLSVALWSRPPMLDRPRGPGRRDRLWARRQRVDALGVAPGAEQAKVGAVNGARGRGLFVSGKRGSGFEVGGRQREVRSLDRNGRDGGHCLAQN
jgi:hypothetical protein